MANHSTPKLKKPKLTTCPKHPEYTGKTSPDSNCTFCWLRRLEVQPNPRLTLEQAFNFHDALNTSRQGWGYAFTPPVDRAVEQLRTCRPWGI